MIVQTAKNGGTGESNRREGIYPLIDALDDRYGVDERIRAARALGESKDPRAITPLIECLKDEDARVRKCCAEALLLLGSIRSVGAFSGILEDRRESPFTRKVAADALAKIRSYTAIECLVGRLVDTREEESLRAHVADALGRTGSLRAIDALEKCLEDENPMVKIESGKALKRIFEFGPSR